VIDAPALDLSLLENALVQFRSVLEDYESHPGVRAYRDSVVIHFVIVYNLTVQVIFRYLEQQSTKIKHSDDLTLPRAVRRALDMGVLKCEWEQFVKYSKARNSVAHVYDLAKAESLVLLAPALQEDATFLLESVKGRIDEA
jgi:hypothetical protein